MLENDFPLHEIDISDTPEEEVLLVSDLPLNRHIKFSFILPIFFFAVFTLVSIFIPSSDFVQSLDDNLTESSEFSIWNTIYQMNSIYQYILLSFQLKGPQIDPKLTLDGNVRIKLYEDNVLVNSLEENITSHPAFEKLLLFSDEIINFDKAITIFNFSTSKELDKNYQSSITTTTMSTLCSLFTNFIRIIFSLILFFLFFGDTNFFFDIDSFFNDKDDKHKTETKKAPKTIEQKITFFLIFTAFLYADPFEVINLSYPSKFNKAIQIFLRDFFYSYLLFYIHAIFSFFTRDPFENQLISLLFPYLFMTISLILFWISDADIYLQSGAKIFPQFNSTNSLLPGSYPDFPSLINLFNVHLLYYAFLFISLIVQIVYSGIKVRKNKIESTQRWIFYSSTSLSLLLFLTIYIVLKIFFPYLIEQTVFDQTYVLIVSLCYVMIMEFGHEETNIEKKDIYVMHDDDNKRGMRKLGGSSINDHSLEVDEDLDKLKEKSNKEKVENKSNSTEKVPENQGVSAQAPILNNLQPPDAQNTNAQVETQK